MLFRSSAAPTKDVGPLHVCDEDAGTLLGPPGARSIPLSVSPQELRVPFSTYQTWCKWGAEGRQAGRQDWRQDIKSIIRKCSLASLPGRIAGPTQGKQDLYLPFT